MKKTCILLFLLFFKENMLGDNNTSSDVNAEETITEILERQNSKPANQRVPVKPFDIPDQSFSVQDFLFKRIENITTEIFSFLTLQKNKENDDISSPFI